MLKLINQIPKPDQDLTDWLTFCHRQAEQEMNLLVYASHRDFLSTPRTYTVIQFYSSEQILVNFNQFWKDEYLDDLLGQELSKLGVIEAAFYQMDDQSPLLMICGDELLEIDADSMTICTQIYHCQSAKQALQQFLAELQPNSPSKSARLSLAGELE